jgi:hypothetical protein
MTTSRRSFLAAASTVPFALAGFGAAAQAAACYDPEKLPLSQKSRRRALGYVEVSSDPKKNCALCSFFTATEPGCGKCQLFSGGPVRGDAVCRSFAPRPAG